MAPRRGRKKDEEKKDPEVEEALRNLGGAPKPAEEPKAEKSLEEQNHIEPAPAAPHVNRKEYDMQIRAGIEGEEREAAVAELLAAMNNVDRQKESRKAVMAEWGSIVSQAEEKVAEWRQILNEGELVTVRVEDVRDFDAGTFKIFRKDTGAIISEGKLNPNEQRELEGLDAPGEGEEQPKAEGEAPAEELAPKEEGEEEEQPARAQTEALDEALQPQPLDRPGKPKLEDD